MSFNLMRSVSVSGFALIAGLVASGSLRAEPDALERPAIKRVAERTASSVMLSITRSGKRLVTVGERGLILWSDDFGQKWQQANVPVSVSLTSVNFFDEKTGWAVGHSGVILRTDDGGENWSKLLDGKQAAKLVTDEAQRPGTDPRFAADADRLVADGPDKPFLDVHFFDENHGLVIGAYGLIFASSDGGKSWQPAQKRIDNPKGLHLYAIHKSGEAIYLVGEQGAIFVSKDGGISFQALTTPYKGTYFGVLSSGPILVAFGMRGNAYWSSDGGVSWEKSTVPGSNSLTAGTRLADGRLALLDDGGNVFLSLDDGKTFSKSEYPKQTPLNSVVEGDNGDLFLAGVRGVSRITKLQAVSGSK